ncbi:hypothetical protein PTE31013_00023 [Pandoraea terrigena]|uniref:Uncharacterized protein n=1 Tax=Pandoraea terrigena TaxID=2508292 RepID=A0A5E4R9N7_9BURK|nr:hypothetical protein PTE31013_00023 [Pandoraea terrigena]
MNDSGFDIVRALRGKDFSHAEFMATYCVFGRCSIDAERFLKKCLTHQLFVPVKLTDSAT